MMYARGGGQERITASPDACAQCPGCGQPVVPKCGSIKVWHWSHIARADCDSWSDGETLWHRRWKQRVRPEATEVVIGPHRADIVGNRGLVVELQHSPIGPDEVAERETFYKRMVWVFDAEEFREHLHFRARDGFVSFRWRWPRWTHLAPTMPLFWDLGDILFLVRKIHEETPCGGWGRWWSHRQFEQAYLSSVLVSASDAAHTGEVCP